MRATATSSVRDRRIRQLGAPLLAAVALGIFAAAGLLLAVVGGIGHIADFVVREAHATAVRMALGADPDLLVWGAFRSTALAAAAPRVARDAARLVRVAGGGGPGALDRDRGSAVLSGAGGAAVAADAGRLGRGGTPGAARRSVGRASVAVERRFQAGTPAVFPRPGRTSLSRCPSRGCGARCSTLANESSIDCSRRSWTTARARGGELEPHLHEALRGRRPHVSRRHGRRDAPGARAHCASGCAPTSIAMHPATAAEQGLHGRGPVLGVAVESDRGPGGSRHVVAGGSVPFEIHMHWFLFLG